MTKKTSNLDPYAALEKQKAYQKKYYKTSKGKDSLRNANFKKKYNITLEEYNVKLKNQNHKCYICGLDEIDNKQKLAVDHDHTTGKVRDLLCSKCNTGLGMFKENIDVLSKAISYLIKHKGL
jgi:hypothetical protein